MTPSTCREAVLEAIQGLERRHARSVFDLEEIVGEVAGRWTTWQRGTITTHVSSHMCRDSPNPQWPDLERVGRGRYRRLGSPALTYESNPPPPQVTPATPLPGPNETGHQFEHSARQTLSRLWSIDLRSAVVTLPGGVDKRFDLVSPDQRIVGDAKRYTSIKTPAAKWSTIAEYVWLLQKLDRASTFLVFGGDADVPQRWLDRFRPLAAPVAFYFLEEDQLTQL